MIEQLNLTVPYKSGTIAAISTNKTVVTVTPSSGTHMIPISAVAVNSNPTITDIDRYLVITEGDGRGQYYRIIGRSGNLYTLDRPLDESSVRGQTNVLPAVGASYSISYDIEEFSDFAGVTGVYKTDELIQIADMIIADGAAVHARNDILSIDPSKFQISGGGWFICGDELQVAAGQDYKALNVCSIWLRQPSRGQGSDINNQFRKHGTTSASGRGQFGVAIFNGTTFLGDNQVNLQMHGHSADFNFSYTRMRSCTINRFVNLTVQGDPEPGRFETFTAIIDLNVDAPSDRANPISIEGTTNRYEFRDPRPSHDILNLLDTNIKELLRRVPQALLFQINDIEHQVTPQPDDTIEFRPVRYDTDKIGFRESVEGEGGQGELVSGDRRVDNVDLPFIIQEIYVRGNSLHLRFPPYQAIAGDITGEGLRVADFEDVVLSFTLYEAGVEIRTVEYPFLNATGTPADNSIGWAGVPLDIQNHTITEDTTFIINIINHDRSPLIKRVEDIHDRVRDLQRNHPENRIFTDDDGNVRIVPLQEKAIRDRNL